MASSSASLLHYSSTLPAAFSPPQLLRRGRGLPPPPQQLDLRPIRRSSRGLSLAASAAASPDVEEEPSPSPQPPDESALSAVAESVAVLKAAAKTRKVPATEVLSALGKIKKAKLDTSAFFSTLGGTESPGRTWMLIFTAQGRLEKGSYFPVTAVQRFDAAVSFFWHAILGPVGSLTFEGRLSWKKKKILAFVFERLRLKVGPLGPLEIGLGAASEEEPGTKDPFFVWFYVDEEIAVAQGRGGGVAFWCRCQRVP